MKDYWDSWSLHFKPWKSNTAVVGVCAGLEWEAFISMHLFLQPPPPWLRQAQPCPLPHLLSSIQSTPAKSAFLDHRFSIASCNLSMLPLPYAIEHPVLATSFLFQGIPYSVPPHWPIFLNNTKRVMIGSWCLFATYTHGVSSYYTFTYGRWPRR